MSGPTTYRHRRRRPRKVGDLGALRRMFWAALLEAEYILLTAEDTETALKAVHAVSQAGSGYAKLLEATDLEARLKKLEATLASLGARNGHARIGGA
jgi:hypothetical protein